MTISDLLEKNVNALIAAKQQILRDPNLLLEFSNSVLEVIKSYQAGSRLYIAGNGGSAADAQHLAAEFVSKLARDRDSLPAEALTVDSSIITAIRNDNGYYMVFSRQVLGKAKENDIFLGLPPLGGPRIFSRP